MQDFKEKVYSDFKKWGQVLNVGEFSAKIKNSLIPGEFNSDNSRLIFSVCSDEGNRLSERENIEKSLTKIYGREFHLGGLAGYPIGGISGIIVASHHVPNVKCTESQQIRMGNLIFFISPHLGLIKTEDYYYGRIIRSCQENPTACCGALMGFLTELKKAGNFENFEIASDINNLDPSKLILQHELLNGYNDELKEILKLDDVNSQIIKLTILNHDLIFYKIKNMIDKFKMRENESFQGKIALISGITINCITRDIFVLKEIKILNN